MNIQGWFLLGLLFWSPCCPRNSQQSSPTPKASILQHSTFFMVQLLHLYVTNRKTVTLTIWTFVSKMMSLFFNMLSRFVIVFLPRSKCLLILWLHSPSTVILEPKKIKSVTISTYFSSICCEVMGLDVMNLAFWVLNFKSVFPLSSFALIKKLFNSSLLSAIRVVSSAYLRLLIFFPEILIPACESSSLAFHMMYSAYMLNKQSDNIQPWCTPLPIFEPVCCSMSNSDCSFLTCIQVFPKIGKISLRIFHSSLWSTKSKTLV